NRALWTRLQIELKLGASCAELNHIARCDAGGPQNSLPVDVGSIPAIQIRYAKLHWIGWVLGNSCMLAADQVVPVGVVLDRIRRISYHRQLFEMIEREFLYLIDL